MSKTKVYNSKRNKGSESDFFKVNICHIVAFDHFKFDFNEENKDSLKNVIIKNVSILSVEPIILNPHIYSTVFVERYPDILKVVLEMNLVNYIENIYQKNPKDIKLFKRIIEACENSLSHKIIIKFCFDQIGVSSTRFDFKLTNPIKTSELIALTNDTAKLVDKIIFNEVKNTLINSIPTFRDKKIVYKVHDTYPIIISTDSNIDIKADTIEIAGITSLNTLFTLFNQDTISKKTNNGFSYYKDTLIMVGHPATFMLFKNPKRISKKPENYIEERINAIEMYHRQKYLLKKIDLGLDNLIGEFGKNNNQNHDINTLKEKMEKIRDTQLDIESKLEIYRNTRTSISASFIILFDTLNQLFRADNHYKFVLDKLNVCDKLYQGLYNELRNELMENIQFIVLTLGGLSLILLFIDMVVDENGTVQLILILSFIIILLIFRNKIKGIYNTLLKERLIPFE